MRALLTRFKNRPEHKEIIVTADSIKTCLQALEKRAKLPTDDLSTGAPESIVVLPILKKGEQCRIASKTDSQWKHTKKEGYISGSITKITEPITPSIPPNPSLIDMMVNIAISRLDALYIGRLYVSRNCPGVFKDNICTSCGKTFRKA